MRRLLGLAFVLTLVGVAQYPVNAQSQPSPSALPNTTLPSTQPGPESVPENPLITTRVRNELQAWQTGHIDRKTYSPAAGGTYDDAIVATNELQLAAIGMPQTVTYQTTSLLFGDFVYRYEIIGTTGAVSVLYYLDGQGKTDGIVFTPLIFRSTMPSP